MRRQQTHTHPTPIGVLDRFLSRKLATYSACAAAVGLSGIATGAADAAILPIDDTTPVITAGQPVSAAPFVAGPPGVSFAELDLDNDGTTDLQLRTDTYLYPAMYTGKQIVFQGLNGGGLVVKTSSADIRTQASVFASGENINGDLRTGFSLAMDNDHPTDLDGSGLYIGFRTASGNLGYLTADADAAADTLQIVGGAFENTGAAISAGEIPEPGTASLGLLALGAAGLAQRRRRGS